MVFKENNLYLLASLNSVTVEEVTVFTMNVNPMPTGKTTLSRADVESGACSQVRQFTSAVLTHLNPCDRVLGILFAKDLYHLGSNMEIQNLRSIFRGYSNKLLSRIYMSELVISEPHLLFSPAQVQFIHRSYQIFINHPQLIQEAKRKDFARQSFVDTKDITALELYILDFSNEIGKYGRYRFADLIQAASRLFGKLLPQEYNEYVQKAKLFQSLVEKHGSILRCGPGLLPKRTTSCLKAFYTGCCSVLICLDKMVAYLDEYDSYFDQDD